MSLGSGTECRLCQLYAIHHHHLLPPFSSLPPSFSSSRFFFLFCSSFSSSLRFLCFFFNGFSRGVGITDAAYFIHSVYLSAFFVLRRRWLSLLRVLLSQRFALQRHERRRVNRLERKERKTHGTASLEYISVKQTANTGWLVFLLNKRWKIPFVERSALCSLLYVPSILSLTPLYHTGIVSYPFRIHIELCNITSTKRDRLNFCIYHFMITMSMLTGSYQD